MAIVGQERVAHRAAVSRGSARQTEEGDRQGELSMIFCGSDKDASVV
jgi:hypothetical protein